MEMDEIAINFVKLNGPFNYAMASLSTINNNSLGVKSMNSTNGFIVLVNTLKPLIEEMVLTHFKSNHYNPPSYGRIVGYMLFRGDIPVPNQLEIYEFVTGITNDKRRENDELESFRTKKIDTWIDYFFVIVQKTYALIGTKNQEFENTLCRCIMANKKLQETVKKARDVNRFYQAAVFTGREKNTKETFDAMCEF